MTQMYLIHSNEAHLIDKQQIHDATTKLIEAVNMAAGSTEGFDLYKVVDAYFRDLDRRHQINNLLGIPQDNEYIAENVEEEREEEIEEKEGFWL